MMFELLQYRLANILRTYRRMARLVHKRIVQEEKNQTTFKEDLKKLMEDVEQGNMQALEIHLQETTKLLESMNRLDVQIQELDLLITRQIANDLQHEDHLAAQIKEKMQHLQVAKELCVSGNEFTQEVVDATGLRSLDELKKRLATVYIQIVKTLGALRNDEQQELYTMIKSMKDEHWEFERLREQIFSVQPVYDALQNSRYLRWNFGMEHKDSEHIVEGEREILRLQLHSAEDIKRLVSDFEQLLKDMKQEDSDFRKLMVAIRETFKLAIHWYFDFYDDEQQVKDFVKKQLREKGYPEEHLKPLDALLDTLDKHKDEILLKLERAARETNLRQAA